MGTDNQLQQQLGALLSKQEQTPTLGSLRDHDLGKQPPGVTSNEFHQARTIIGQIDKTIALLNGITKMDAFQGAPPTNIIADISQRYGFVTGAVQNPNTLATAPIQAKNLQTPSVG